MIAPSTPGMTEDVLRADLAEWARAAEERRLAVTMRRERRAARAEARRARRLARPATPRRRHFPRLARHARRSSTA